MADHKKLQVLKAMTTLIEGADWPTGLTVQVFRGRAIFSTQEDTIISLLESPVGVDHKYVYSTGDRTRQIQTTWNLICQGWTADDMQNPCDPLYPLMGAVQERLSRMIATDSDGAGVYPEDFRLGGLIADAKISDGVVRPPDIALSDKAFFQMSIQIVFMFDLTSPSSV